MELTSAARNEIFLDAKKRGEKYLRLPAKTCAPRVLVEGVRLLGEVRKNFKQINADSEKTLFFYISWATIFGNLVTNRLVHALLCSDVHARAQHAVAKSLKNGPPKKKRPTERLFSALFGTMLIDKERVDLSLIET